MKAIANYALGITLILGAAALHILPIVGVVMIATGSETTKAFGALITVVSGFFCGYIHGLNNTSFKL